jgi:ASC-1-like (ASCH) protein
MNIDEIKSAIMFGGLSNEQLESVIAAVKYARAQLTQQTRRSLRVGDTVKFTSSRTGQSIRGAVEKIAIKYVNVRTSQGVYRVPANMLEAI